MREQSMLPCRAVVPAFLVFFPRTTFLHLMFRKNFGLSILNNQRIEEYINSFVKKFYIARNHTLSTAVII